MGLVLATTAFNAITMSWEQGESPSDQTLVTDGTTGEAIEEGTLVRKSTRVKRPTKFLKVDPKQRRSRFSSASSGADADLSETDDSSEDV